MLAYLHNGEYVAICNYCLVSSGEPIDSSKLRLSEIAVCSRCGGGGRKDPNQKKVVLSLSVTSKVKERIVEKAALVDMSITEYVLWLCDHSAVVDYLSTLPGCDALLLSQERDKVDTFTR